MTIRRTALQHAAALQAANGGAWPQSTQGYIRLAWLMGGLSCIPDRKVPKARLVPDGHGHWEIRYNPDLLEDAIKCHLLHEMSEYMSRRRAQSGPSLFAGRYAGESTASADGRPVQLGEIRKPADIWHEVAVAVQKLWCAEMGFAYDKITTRRPVVEPKAAQSTAEELLDDRYSKPRPEVTRVSIHADGRVFGKYQEVPRWTSRDSNA